MIEGESFRKLIAADMDAGIRKSLHERPPISSQRRHYRRWHSARPRHIWTQSRLPNTSDMNPASSA